MLEDLFKVVTKRFNDDSSKPAAAKPAKKDNPEVFRCPRCQKTFPLSQYTDKNKICPGCNYHGRLTAMERLSITADKNSFIEYDKDMTSSDPIGFPDYTVKQAVMQNNTGLKEAVITGECTIKGSRTVIIIMDSHFMMASMGSVVGEKITRAFEMALKKGLPVVAFTASGGARMQEGIISLMQMAKTSGAAAKHSESGLLYITVLTDPTTGGVTASFASLGDIILAEPKILIGFAGRRVIEGTIKQHLPDDFQLSEFMLEKGFVDRIVNRNRMRSVLSHLLKLHGYEKEEA